MAPTMSSSLLFLRMPYGLWTFLFVHIFLLSNVAPGSNFSHLEWDPAETNLLFTDLQTNDSIDIDALVCYNSSLEDYNSDSQFNCAVNDCQSFLDLLMQMDWTKMRGLKGFSGQKYLYSITMNWFGCFYRWPLMVINGHSPPLSITSVHNNSRLKQGEGRWNTVGICGFRWNKVQPGIC